MDIKGDEAVEDLLRGRLRIIQKKEGYRFSIDAILLSNFARIKKGEKVADLGTGSGVIPLILSWRNPDVGITGIEIDGAAADMARRSVELNSLAGRISIFESDIREVRSFFPPEGFDATVMNPPYGKPHTGRISRGEGRAAARHELVGSLEDFTAAAAYLTRFRGRIYVIYPARRLADLICILRENGFEPKKMRIVHSMKGESAKLVLVEGVKGGGVEMEIEKPLYIYGSDGCYSAEVEDMYR